MKPNFSRPLRLSFHSALAAGIDGGRGRGENVWGLFRGVIPPCISTRLLPRTFVYTLVSRAHCPSNTESASIDVIVSSPLSPLPVLHHHLPHSLLICFVVVFPFRSYSTSAGFPPLFLPSPFFSISRSVRARRATLLGFYWIAAATAFIKLDVAN